MRMKAVSNCRFQTKYGIATMQPAKNAQTIVCTAFTARSAATVLSGTGPSAATILLQIVVDWMSRPCDIELSVNLVDY